ncbi:hypothetical protein [Teredinibacter franksiae]|uniref:hypothetical protein n=1 Tax=Teredinibacter franksiae TaxID=2761453 RepID=UPI0016254ED1|nr:hypothetical protein [Teredinibacter franksiae]
MEYRDEQEIALGDIVELDMPNGRSQGRVVMLGENYEYLELESTFETWVKSENILDADSVVIEWINENPLEHDDPQYAPVGNYIFTGISEDLKLVRRRKLKP